MRRLLPALLTVSFLYEPALAAEADPPKEPGNKLDLSEGQRIYQSACARCHDEGKDGAPKISQPSAWRKSSISSFSLMEDHVKNGFLMMPAEGQHSSLSETDLANATYYVMHRVRIRP